MIARQNRALSEWIRDRCERTGIANIVFVATQIKFTPDVLLSFSFAVLLL
jgi:hypothetical protein